MPHTQFFFAFIQSEFQINFSDFFRSFFFVFCYCLDEKEKYDPTGFRDAVIAGLEKSGNDLESISKYLDIAGNKLDYRRYGEVLFDILIAGGLLVPGGSISQDGEKPSTEYCVFRASEDMESMRNHEQVFIKLMRRYKYLEKMFEEEMKKVLIFIKGFTPSERIKLARMTALWIGKWLDIDWFDQMKKTKTTPDLIECMSNSICFYSELFAFISG